jgi:hypothetical protein
VHDGCSALARAAGAETTLLSLTEECSKGGDAAARLLLLVPDGVQADVVEAQAAEVRAHGGNVVLQTWLTDSIVALRPAPINEHIWKPQAGA